jgi:hypothetical protein
MNDMLEPISDCVNQVTEDRLQQPLIEPELKRVVESMARGKAPGLNGYAIDFYVKLWPILEADFIEMVLQSIARGWLPQGMNEGLIALFHKGSPTNELNNYRPITLLNVSYKIVAKALQHRLQPSLPDLISEDQTAFLPLRYILDNVLVQSETI